MQVKYEPWKVNEQTNIWGIRVLDSEYAGTMIAFNEFDSEDDSNEFKLDYTIIQAPEGKLVEDLRGPEFDSMLNFIVNDILLKAINDYENRNGNSTESSE